MSSALGQLRHRSLWSIDDLSRADLATLLETALACKTASGPRHILRGRRIVVLRDRSDGPHAAAFQRAADALGATITIVPTPVGVDGEARLLGRLYDAVDCVAMEPTVLERIEHSAGIPVYNGLSDKHLPTRVLSTLLGLVEASRKPMQRVCLACVADARKPAVASLLYAGGLAGFELRIAGEFRPPERLMRKLQAVARDSGARVSVIDSPDEAAAGADAVLRPGGPLSDALPTDDDVFMLQAMLLATLS
jgi:ornithine carbamoyltransferase